MCGRTPKARRQLDLISLIHASPSWLNRICLISSGHFSSSRESIIVSQLTGLDHIHLRVQQEITWFICELHGIGNGAQLLLLG